MSDIEIGMLLERIRSENEKLHAIWNDVHQRLLRIENILADVANETDRENAEETTEKKG